MGKEINKTPLAPGLIDLQGFTATQNETLLDLLVLAMYLDGNLAKIEETRVQQLLTAMGYATEYDRNRQFDASVTRIRRQSQTPEAVKACAARLAGNFTAAGQQQQVYDFLRELTALDGSVSTEENKFLAAIKEAFRL